ncbi:MAG: HEAT repeat domain-containing protein [Anaerolineae bacterium]|nr:HEAT repeat domain-containing protein [Anaerolineae bacterium]
MNVGSDPDHGDRVGQLIAALQRDPDELVRGSAAIALGELGDRRAMGPLRAARDDAEGFVREEAAMALKELEKR